MKESENVETRNKIKQTLKSIFCCFFAGAWERTIFQLRKTRKRQIRGTALMDREEEAKNGGYDF